MDASWTRSPRRHSRCRVSGVTIGGPFAAEVAASSPPALTTQPRFTTDYGFESSAVDLATCAVELKLLLERADCEGGRPRPNAILSAR